MTDLSNHTLKLLRRIREENRQGVDEIKRFVENLAAETRITNGYVLALVRHIPGHSSG